MQRLRRCLGLGIVLTGLVYAQPAPQVIVPGEAEVHILQPGDQLEINILTLPDLEKRYAIRADGTFFHPFAGVVQASGKTLPQIEAFLRQRFRKQIRNPEFRVGMSTMADSEVAVLGEVRAPGKLKFPPGTSVLTLLAQVGGVTDKADLDGAILLRGGKQIQLDLGPAGQPELSRLVLRNGDILYFNRGRRVGVSGEVQLKGIYSISSRSTHPVEDAVKAAGGASENAALNRIQIIRPSLAKPIEVDLLNPQGNQVALEDGDTVLVPPRKVIVMGAVAKVGNLPLQGSETLLDVVSLAGAKDSDIDTVIVVRAADVQAGNEKKEVYNMKDSFSEGKPLLKVPIYDGDLVYVPTKQESQGMLGSNALGMLNLIYMARSLFGV